VTEKYRSKGLVVLAVNIVEKQDDLVRPFLNEHHYTFTAFKGNPDIMQAYAITGVPTEYVIDRQGRVVAKVRLASDDRERQFEKLVESLLQ
jgi:glutathione peroxidase-family protein